MAAVVQFESAAGRAVYALARKSRLHSLLPLPSSCDHLQACHSVQQLPNHVLVLYLIPTCRPDLTAEERDTVLQDLVREITALWQTDELRRERPTPIDGEQQCQQQAGALAQL